MRFKKGSKVEVLTKNEMSSSDWRCGEIVSGNGHTYNVRFEYSAMTSDAAVDKVPRKLIRPSAPLGKNVDSWAFGDVVEVYVEGSWKVALVKQVVGGDSYLVRLLGASEVFRVHRSNIRMRQLWKDDQWVVIGKGAENCEGQRKPCPKRQGLSHKILSKKEKDENGCLISANAHFLDSPLLTSRVLKRSSPCCTSTIEASCKKLRTIEREGERLWFSSAFPLPLTGKVDAVAYPYGCMDEKNMHTSFANNQTNGCHNTMRVYHDNSAEHLSERCSEPTDSCSDASSVASCSVVLDGQDKFSSPMLVGSFQDGDDFSSSAGSLGVGKEEEMCTLSPQEDVASRIHSLELHTYRCTLEAMFASGPLSWEQEAVLTNLRISLHITNDEHLMELRNLISGPTLAARWSCFQRLKMRLYGYHLLLVSTWRVQVLCSKDVHLSGTAPHELYVLSFQKEQAVSSCCSVQHHGVDCCCYCYLRELSFPSMQNLLDTAGVLACKSSTVGNILAVLAAWEDAFDAQKTELAQSILMLLRCLHKQLQSTVQLQEII